MKIAACVILYNPDNSVEQNINSYINQTGKIYIVDNSKTCTYKTSPANNTSQIIIHDGLNNGIAKRLNQVCELAIQDGFEYLLTMDQDSFFDTPAITSYLQCINNFKNKEEIAMFGVNYNHQTGNEDCTFSDVKFLITSGSIINLNAFKNIGAFDENLFIDFIDSEYCLRSLQNGYKLIEFKNIYMHHNLGDVSTKHSLKTLKKSGRSFHSSIRLYYMLRNFLYVNHKYKKEFSNELSIFKKDVINRIKNKLLYKSNRWQTIKLLMKAINDYKANKMGKQF